MNSLTILPTFNEKGNLDSLVRAILKIEPAEPSVLIVDDNSPDGTGELADQLCLQFPNRVFALHRAQKQGLGNALKAGFNWGLKQKYDPIITMDADWSHHPKAIPRLLKASKKADLIIGSRYIPGGKIIRWPKRRFLISKLGNYYTDLITGLPIKDVTSGFHCLKRSALKTIEPQKINSQGYAFQIELKYRAWKKGLSLKEVPITFYPRRAGQPKMSASIVWEALLAPWRLILNIQNDN